MYGKTGDETFGDLAEKYVDRAKQALFCWDTIQDGHFRWNWNGRIYHVENLIAKSD